MFPCGCDDDEYAPCEEHADIVFVREGASTRTGDESMVQFIDDAVELGVELSAWGRAALADAKASLSANERMGVRWLPDDEAGEALGFDLQRLHDQVETELARMDEHYCVSRNDGYVIFQLHMDCPLID